MQTTTAPICRHFRSKKMFVSGAQNEAPLWEEFDPHGGAHCWCNKTMTEIGADDQLVCLRGCADVARRCYEAL